MQLKSLCDMLLKSIPYMNYGCGRNNFIEFHVSLQLAISQRTEYVMI